VVSGLPKIREFTSGGPDFRIQGGLFNSGGSHDYCFRPVAP
jgi:hypothetical protein